MKGRRRPTSLPASERQGPVPHSDVAPEMVASPFAGRVWTDADGTTWTRRGSQVSTSRVRRLMGRADVTVVHTYAGDTMHVPVPEREALWRRVEPYLRDSAREQGDHTDFLVGEFRSASGGSLLMLEERC